MCPLAVSLFINHQSSIVSPPPVRLLDVLVMGDTVPAIKCDASDKDMTDCDEKEQKYIVKVKGWTPEKRQSEIGRLFNILQNPMSDDLRDWARRRANIVKHLLGTEQEKETNEL